MIDYEECREALGLPEGSSERLIKLKIAEIELATKRRKEDNTLLKLEEMLKDETERLMSLKVKIDQDLKDKTSKKTKMLNHHREAEYYRNKLDKMDINKLDEMEDEIKVAQMYVFNAKDKLNALQQSLKVYGNLEPTNEALKASIKELKASRLSLDVSFI